MRIQDTDRILKESRHARQAVVPREQEEVVKSRAWRIVSSIPGRLSGLFKR